MPAQTNPLQLFLQKLRQHSALTDGDADALLALPFIARTMESGAYLLREGDMPEHCPILGDGFAYRQKLTGDGLRQIVSLHIPGDALDLQHLFLSVADHSVQMLTRGHAAFVLRPDLEELIRARSGVARAVLTALLVEGSISREWVLNVGRRDARARLAHLLCEFAVRMSALDISGTDGFTLPITQEQLADMLGFAIAHTNRTLKSLEDDGLLTRNKRYITFQHIGRLREIGDFNERYLHLDREALPFQSAARRNLPRVNLD